MNIKLQGIHDRKKGTPVSDLKIGYVVLWNFGYKSQVVSIHPTKSGKSANLGMKSLEDGIVRSRLMRRSAYVVKV